MKKLIRESIEGFDYSKDINEGMLGDIGNKIKSFFGKLFKPNNGELYVAMEENGEGIIHGAIAPINIAIMDRIGLLPNGVNYVATNQEKKIEKSISNMNASKAIANTEKNLKREQVSEGLTSTGASKGSRMPEVNVKELMEIIDNKIFDPETAALGIWGAPGIGKTEIVKSVLNNYDGDRRLIDIQTTTMVPDDWSLPVIAKDEIAKSILEASMKTEALKLGFDYDEFMSDPTNPKYGDFRKKMDLMNNPAEYLRAIDIPKSWLPVYIPTGDVEEDKRRDQVANGPDNLGGIIFLDELSRASAEVQNTCLKLVQEKQINGALLGSKWFVIAASNREEDEDMDFGITWSNALGNRFEQYNFFPEYKEWREWGTGNIWPSIIQFLDYRNTQFFYTLTDDDVKNQVFASPRSWANASKAIQSMFRKAKERGEPQPRIDMIGKVLSAYVGTDIGKAFKEFLHLMKNWSDRDIKMILTDAKKAKMPSSQGIRKVSPQEFVGIMGIIQAKLHGKILTKKQWENFNTYLVRIDDMPLARVGATMIIDDHEEIPKGLGESGTDPFNDGKEYNWPDTYVKGLNILLDHYNKMKVDDVTGDPLTLIQEL